MTRYDLRWIRRHPFRWVRLMWFQWTLALMLGVMAFVVAEPVFVVTTAAAAWPIILGIAAGAVATSALAPLEDRLQAFVAALLFAVAVLRVATFVDTYLRAGDAVSVEGQMVLVAFGLHWTLVAALAWWLPTIAEHAGREMAVETGRDDRAGP